MRRLRAAARLRLAKTPPSSALATKLLREAVACVTGWGSPQLGAELVAAAPKLRLVAHSAGSVKPFVSDALWARGIRVTSAAAAIAVEVAHFTFALITLGAKNVWEMNRRVRAGGWGWEGSLCRELCGATVGICGAGQVGRRVLGLLSMNPPKRVLLYDPFVSATEAKRLGARKSSLEKLLRASDVISLHVPLVAATRHLLNAKRLALIRDGATLINTARGALIDEAALISELRRGRFRAFLDVTDPEPPVADHPFRWLPNVFLTPHIAGSVAEGRLRQGDLVTEEILRFLRGGRLRYEVRKEQLDRIG